LISLPVIVGHEFSQCFRLDGGPKIVMLTQRYRDQSTSAGASIGASISARIGVGRSWFLAPEFQLLRTIAGEVLVDGLIASGGVGIGRGW
jgi:hypothetical protein